jgi:hypothetical protein
MINQARCTSVAVVILFMLAIPAGLYYVSPLSAQTDGETNSASQNYQDFQSCLSNAEANGFASEQQVSDCFDESYGTGSGNLGVSPSSTDTGSNDENDPTGPNADSNENDQ